MTAGFRVHPAELTAAGEAARHTAERLRADVGAMLGPSDAAVAALPGWRTAAALQECTDAWHRLLGGLAEEMDGVGTDLLRTSANYTSAEDDAHRGLQAVH